MLTRIAAFSLIALIGRTAHAQLQLDWFTIDGGGGTSTGGNITITGTIGQPVAGAMTNGNLQCLGGFWAAFGTSACYPNCDGSSVAPALNVNDFQCFVNAYAIGASYANCDQSTVAPTLNVNDFQCFLNAYAVGCS